jgi:hypothetical protein
MWNPVVISAPPAATGFRWTVKEYSHPARFVMDKNSRDKAYFAPQNGQDERDIFYRLRHCRWWLDVAGTSGNQMKMDMGDFLPCHFSRV